MDSVTRFFASGFFHESPSPKPLKITVGSFRIFSKIRGDIRKSKCTNDVNDTSGKFATDVNDIGGKKLPPVSTTPAANLPPVHRHRRQILPPVPLVCQRRQWQIATGVVDTSGK
jgi:hypothetical protein